MKRTLWLVCIGAALGACDPKTPPDGSPEVGPAGAHLVGRLVRTGGSLGESGWGAGVITTTAPARNAAGDELCGGLTGE